MLDRCGLGPSASLAVTAAAPAPPWVEWMTVDQLRLMRGVIGDAKGRMDAGEPRPPQCVSRVVYGAAAGRDPDEGWPGEGDDDHLLLEAALVQEEVERPVIREIVTVIVDPPKRD